MDTERVILSEKQKALSINLNQDLYGTFAEIGAGQEVVRVRAATVAVMKIYLVGQDLYEHS